MSKQRLSDQEDFHPEGKHDTTFRWHFRVNDWRLQQEEETLQGPRRILGQWEVLQDLKGTRKITGLKV